MDLANGKRVTGDLRRGVKVSPQLTSERLFFTDLLTTLLTILADLIACLPATSRRVFLLLVIMILERLVQLLK